MGQYFYLYGTDPVGPFSLQDVYTLIDREVIGPATMVCKEGSTNWQEMLLLPELNGKANPESSSPLSSGRRRRKGRVNLTAIIIAVLFSLVAVYITYTISHAGQESPESTQELDRLLGR